MTSPFWIAHLALALACLAASLGLPGRWRWLTPLTATALFACVAGGLQWRSQGPVFAGIAFALGAAAGLAPVAAVALLRQAVRLGARFWLGALLVALALVVATGGLVGFDLWASRERWRACNRLHGQVPFSQVERYLRPRGAFLPLHLAETLEMAGGRREVWIWGLFVGWGCTVDELDGRAHVHEGSGSPSAHAEKQESAPAEAGAPR